MMYLVLAELVQLFNFHFEIISTEDLEVESDEFNIGTRSSGVLKTLLLHTRAEAGLGWNLLALSGSVRVPGCMYLCGPFVICIPVNKVFFYHNFFHDLCKPFTDSILVDISPH
jgi:hypothetical protein